MSSFCPLCGNGLQIKEDAQLRYICRTCPYTCSIVRDQIFPLNLKKKQVDDVLGGSEAWENVDKTQGTHTCYNTFVSPLFYPHSACVYPPVLIVPTVFPLFHARLLTLSLFFSLFPVRCFVATLQSRAPSAATKKPISCRFRRALPTRYAFFALFQLSHSPIPTHTLGLTLLTNTRLRT